MSMLSVDNTAAVIIDVQGKLWNVMHEKEALLENLQKLVKGIRLIGIPIILTEQNPAGLGPTMPELMQFMSAVKPIPKFCFNCHREKNFDQVVRGLEKHQILLCGIEAHICVYQTAMDLLGHGYEVQVVADAVSSRVARNRDITLMRLQHEGAKLTTVEMVLYELLQTAENPKFKEMLKVVK
jgi:nicotinamidase-related amidase